MHSTDAQNDGGGPLDGPLPEFVDWIAAGVIALAGLALTVGGTAMTAVVDRETIAAGVESDQVDVVFFERELTEAESVDFALAVVDWTGMGLLVTGIGLVVFALGFAVVRHRAHGRTPAGEPAGTARSYAVLGAVTTGVTSFVPFSPVVGGGVAGYLEHRVRGRSVGAGALSGLLSALPALSILVFVTGGLFAGFSTVRAEGVGALLIAVMALAVLVVAAYGAAFGAIGGFLGGRLAGDGS
jgi:hypothetical protein